MATSFSSADEIESLVARFVDCTLPCADWTHQAHLTVGLWHLREFPPAAALDMVRQRIRKYNGACNVPNSETRGYHETITRFYMTVIGQYLASVLDRSNWTAVTNELVARIGDREFPFRYYTRERLMSPEARAGWVAPDLQPL